MRVLKLKQQGSQQWQDTESMCRVLEYLSDAAAVTEGIEHRLVFINDTFARLCPAGKETLGRRLTDVLPREFVGIARFLEPAYRTGEVFTLEEYETVGDNGSQWWKLTVVPRGTSTGQLVLLMHEISPRVKARLDEAVYKSRVMAEERAFILESLIQSISDPVVLVNPLGQVVGLNREAADYWGVEPGIFLECNLEYSATAMRSYSNGSLMERHELPVFRALRGEVVRGEEILVESIRKPENKRVFSISASPVRDSQGSIILGVSVARDISERVNFERAKDGFISVASHEMRTPLGIVRGMAQLMEMTIRRKTETASRVNRLLEGMIERGELSVEIKTIIDEFLQMEKEQQYCASIINRVDQMARLINEVLDASRLETGQVEINNWSFDLLPVIQEVCNRLQITTDFHQIKVEAEGERHLVFGDRDRLDQVVTNLVANAIKYSPQGGVITVRVRDKTDEIEVSVNDQGVGIPEKEQRFIFERFYRAQNVQPGAFSGLGLGLHISKQIIMEHGGNMWVESLPGRGSTFYFALPSDDAY